MPALGPRRSFPATRDEVMRCLASILAIAAFLGLSGCRRAEEPKVPGPQVSPVSRPNTPERIYSSADAAGDQNVMFPGDGGMTDADRDTTGRIRAAIMRDMELAPAGSNITVNTRHGKVELKGRVSSKQEQRAIAAMVEKQTGTQPAANELQVRTAP